MGGKDESQTLRVGARTLPRDLELHVLEFADLHDLGNLLVTTKPMRRLADQHLLQLKALVITSEPSEFDHSLAERLALQRLLDLHQPGQLRSIVCPGLNLHGDRFVHVIAALIRRNTATLTEIDLWSPRSEHRLSPSSKESKRSLRALFAAAEQCQRLALFGAHVDPANAADFRSAYERSLIVHPQDKDAALQLRQSECATLF